MIGNLEAALQQTKAAPAPQPAAAPTMQTMTATAAPTATPPMSQITNLGGLGSIPQFMTPAMQQQQQAAQAAYKAKNTYVLTKPKAGLTAAETADYQLRDGVKGFQFATNKGNAAGIKAKEVGEKRGTAGDPNESGFVPYVEGAKYRIWNEKGKDKLLYEGDNLAKVYRYAQNLSATKGKKANWGVEMLDPGSSQWRRVADDDPAKGLMGTLGKIAGMALPIGAAFIPGLNVLGTIAVQAAAGGAGAALAGRNPLKGALMGGLTAAGGAALGPVLKGGLGVSKGVGTALGTGLGATAGGLATGQSIGNALKGGVLAGGLSGPTSELGIGPKGSATVGNGEPYNLLAGTPFDGIVTTPLGGVVGTGGSAGNGALGVDGEITVDGVKPATGSGGSLGLGGTGGGTYNGSEITVDGVKAPSGGLNGVPIGAGMFGASPEVQKALEDAANAETDPKKKAGILEYLKAAGLLSSLLGGVFGGKGSAIGGGQIPGGVGGLNPIFTDNLPKATLPTGTKDDALTASQLAARGLRTTNDWYRYGYGPEQSFFNNVKQPARNTSQAYTGYARGGEVEGGALEAGNIDLHRRPIVRNRDGSISTVRSRSFGMPQGEVLLPTVSDDGRILTDEEALALFQQTGRHLGVFRTPDAATRYAQQLHEDQAREYAGKAKGGSFAVTGPGDGREDKIPAALSDGEYVMDAETVALLGNGSNKAGADALDDFRVNLRKHKGRELSKGSFSAKAKRPEQYLKKGRK